MYIILLIQYGDYTGNYLRRVKTDDADINVFGNIQVQSKTPPQYHGTIHKIAHSYNLVRMCSTISLENTTIQNDSKTRKYLITKY